ncbi:MAG: membrane protein insertase YidC, partial [Acidobacteria bacterium]
GSEVRVTGKPVTLVFEYQDQDGLSVRKAITFEPDSYVFKLAWDVERGGQQLNPTIVWGPALGPVATPPSSYHQRPQAMLYRSGKVERWNAGDLREAPVQEAQFRYVGVDEHYFAVLALPEATSSVARFEPFEVPIPGADERAVFVSWSIRVARPQTSLRFFVGPKDFDILQQTDQELVRTINYGVFSWLAVPLLRALKGINAYVGNYGWSIIILTVLINLLMFPLRHKSVVSMRRMQELQPQIKAIQDRYGKLKTTDPARQKMNVELMNLYREKGVNPASGCLPMALTMPVLFAFYSLLSQAIEIRHAPFALWIKDLSVHDPYYVTPVIMGATMLVQQKMTPTSADPAQQRMMMIMPLVFLFMFLWAPSGLVIYWLFSNLLAIGQQYATNRMIGAAVPVAPRPPAQRQLKKVGGGRTETAGKSGE